MRKRFAFCFALFLLLTAFVGCWLEQIRLDGIRRLVKKFLEKNILND